MTQEVKVVESEPKFIGYLDSDKTIKISRTEHYIYKNHKTVKQGLEAVWGKYKQEHPEYKSQFSMGFDPTKCVMGRWHYFYTKDNKHISLVKTLRGFGGMRMLWEICSGGTCEGCCDAEELFDTRKEAEIRILELMT